MLSKLIEKAKSNLLLIGIGGAVILFAAVFFLSWRVETLSTSLNAEKAKVVSLEQNFAAFQAESSLIARTVDLAAVDKRQLEEERSYGHDFVRSSSGASDADPDRGWSEFFDFLRDSPESRTRSESTVAREPVPVSD